MSNPHWIAAYPVRAHHCAVLCAVLFWVAAPYAGIRHDAIFYAGDALRRLHPQAFSLDIFFHQGSQGDFSIFGRAYAALIQAMGLDPAAFTMTLVGRALWLISLVGLTRALVPSPGPWVLLLAAAICLPGDYGALGLLTRAESFATPRIYAEAASLLAVALALRSRWGPAGVAWLLAMALHPLMGVFAGGVMAGLLPHRRLAWAAALVGGLLIAAWALHTGVLQRLALRFDDAWFGVVEGRNRMILWRFWTPGQFSQALLALLLLVDVRRRLPSGDQVRRAAVTLLAMTGICLLLWFWASESRNVLLLQVQPWRVLWLTLLLAPLCWLAAVMRAERLLLLPAALLFLAWVLPYWPAVAIGALALGLQARPRLWAEPRRKWLVGLLVLGLAGVAVLDMADRLLWAEAAEAGRSLHWQHVLAAWLAEPLVAVGIVGLAWKVVARTPASRGTTSAAVALLLLAVAGWSAWIMLPPPDATERHLATLARGHIPEGACVWSELGLASTWLDLQRCSYVTSAQGAGAQFDRGLAMALRVRLDRLNRLGVTRESWHQDAEALTSVRAPDAAMVGAACEDQALDWLVFRGSVPAAHVVIQDPDQPGRLSLFDCRRLRPRQDV